MPIKIYNDTFGNLIIDNGVGLYNRPRKCRLTVRPQQETVDLSLFRTSETTSEEYLVSNVHFSQIQNEFGVSEATLQSTALRLLSIINTNYVVVAQSSTGGFMVSSGADYNGIPLIIGAFASDCYASIANNFLTITGESNWQIFLNADWQQIKDFADAGFATQNDLLIYLGTFINIDPATVPPAVGHTIQTTTPLTGGNASPQLNHILGLNVIGLPLNVPSGDEFVMVQNDPSGIFEKVPLSSISGRKREEFIATNLQTVFNLAAIPQNALLVEMYIQTHKRVVNVDFTVFGNTVTYNPIAGGYPINTGDIVEFYYT